MSHSKYFFWLYVGILLMGVYQSHSQGISGKVYDEITLEPLPSSTIEVVGMEKGIASGPLGEFSIEGLRPGRYILQVSHVGYETQVLSDIWVRSGKETRQDFYLRHAMTDLPEVVVVDRLNPMRLGALRITEEQINRLAATYYDPARVILNSPDVSVSNDQNNLVSVRGIAPYYNTWRLEGAEIVNPNHLSNAGTFSDQPASSGGGVNILSAQMLGSSGFLYDDMDNQFGNSLGGIFDMRFREGSHDDFQYTAQASLIGLDFSAEGPLSRRRDISFLTNYRYSFTGLLTAAGVDFGGESIGFQDLSFNMTIPFDDQSVIKVFGSGGLNFNYFSAKAFDESEVQKDRSDIDFNGKMGVLGASARFNLKNGYATYSFAVSSSGNIRDQTTYDSLDTEAVRIETERNMTVASLAPRHVFNVGKGHATVGALLNIYKFRHNEFNSTNPGSFSLIEQVLLNPYMSFTFPLFNRLEINGGGSYYVTGVGHQSVDPRLRITFIAGANTRFSLAAGGYSQLLNPLNEYFIELRQGGDFYSMSHTFDFQQAIKYSASWNQEWREWSLSTEVFGYQFPDITLSEPLDVKEQAGSYGASLQWNRGFLRGWYFSGGGAYFHSYWGENYDNRYNTRFNATSALGKEWILNNETRNRSLSVNGRLMYQGGLVEPYFNRETPPVVTAVTENRDFIRADLRVQWVINREARTSSVSLDIQNVLNRKNDSYQYFDALTGEWERQYQLGLIPILTYRVEF